MDALSKIGIWVNRTVLIAISIVFASIAFKFLFNPIGTTSEINISLGSAAAITVARVSLGGFPLVISLLTVSSIFSLSQHLRGIATVVTVVAILTIARIYGIAVDGATAHNIKLLYPEGVSC